MSDDPSADLEAFLASSRRLHDEMRRALTMARRWAWFWFLCFAISVGRRVLAP